MIADGWRLPDVTWSPFRMSGLFMTQSGFARSPDQVITPDRSSSKASGGGAGVSGGAIAGFVIGAVAAVLAAIAAAGEWKDPTSTLRQTK